MSTTETDRVRKKIIAAMDRLIAGKPLRSTGRLNVAQLASRLECRDGISPTSTSTSKKCSKRVSSQKVKHRPRSEVLQLHSTTFNRRIARYKRTAQNWRRRLSCTPTSFKF